MAFTFRASSSYDSGNSNNATVSKPTGTVDGDIMFALVTSVNFSTVSSSPSGWSLIATKSDFGGFRLYYKIASSEGSSYSWTYPGSGQVRVTIASYYGDYNSSNPIDVISNTVYSTSNTTIRAASMTVSSLNSPLLFFGLTLDQSANTFTKPSVPTTDWVENVDAGSTNSDLYHTFCLMIWSSSGSTGNMDATSSLTPDDKHAFAVAINPPVVAPTVTTQAVTNQATTSGTGNGNITATGGANSFMRGFAYFAGNSADITMGIISDPSFESGVGSFSNGQGTKSNTQAKYGSSSLKVTYASGSEAVADFYAVEATYQTKTVTFGSWVWCDTAGVACLDIYDNNGGGYEDSRSSYHTGDSTWQWLTITRTCRASLTDIIFRCHWNSGNAGSAYFDGTTIAISGSSATPYITFDSGDYGAGAFTKSITGLSSATAYRVTAFAQNNVGVGYGSTVDYTTLASGPANLKSLNTNLKANIKTINGNPIANVKSLNTNV